MNAPFASVLVGFVTLRIGTPEGSFTENKSTRGFSMQKEGTQVFASVSEYEASTGRMRKRVLLVGS